MRYQQTLSYLAVGGAAGVINGLFGAGGGLLLVPLFISICRLDTKTAFATSLCVTLSLSVVSLTVYCLRGTVDFTAALPYAVGGLAGGVIGGLIMKRCRLTWLRAALAALLLYGGVKAVMLW